MKNICVIVFAVFFIACNNTVPLNEDKDEAEVEERGPNPLLQKLVVAFPEIYQGFVQQDSSFLATRFELAGYDSLSSVPLSETNELKAYYPYFIYNEDSSYAIDLYSYNILLVKRNGKTVAEEAGPDTEVGLVDLKNKTRQRIYFGGSSSVVLAARWSDRREFFVLTGENIGNNKFHPSILSYNTETRTISHFEYPDTLNIKPMEYRQGKLKEL